jgi:hypothetical protein
MFVEQFDQQQFVDRHFDQLLSVEQSNQQQFVDRQRSQLMFVAQLDQQQLIAKIKDIPKYVGMYIRRKPLMYIVRYICMYML